MIISDSVLNFQFIKVAEHENFALADSVNPIFFNLRAPQINLNWQHLSCYSPYIM